MIIKIAIASTALSLIVMIVSSAILDGFNREIHQKVFGFWGNIHLTSTNITRNFDLKPISINAPYYDKISKIGLVKYQNIDEKHSIDEVTLSQTKGGVKHAQPYIILPGLLESSEGFQAILFKGVDERYNWDNMSSYLKAGSFPLDSMDQRSIFISKSIASKIKKTVGDEVIISFIKDRSKVKRKVKIDGVYNTGLEEYDQRFVIGSMPLLQNILDWSKDEVSGIEVILDYPEDAKVISEFLYENIIPLDMYAETIQDKFPSIFEWLKFLEINETVIYELMIIVALINMITVVLILILEKFNLIGILKSLGATNRSIKKIFLINGAQILGWGLLYGNIIGLGIAFLQKQFGIVRLDEESYYLDTAPIYIDWVQVILFNLGTCVVILIALLIPLIVISKITPVKTLKFN
jgi:lipoprotein-releasing system permease protein